MTISFATIKAIEDYISGAGKGSASPFQGAFGITPSNTNNLVHQTRGIFIGGAGTLHVTMADGSDATFTGIIAGTMLNIAATRVWSTGTSATNITAVY